MEVGIKNIYEKEMYLTKVFIDAISDIDEILLIGKKDMENRTSVVSLDFKNLDNGLVCHQLDKFYNIQEVACTVLLLPIKLSVPFLMEV